MTIFSFTGPSKLTDEEVTWCAKELLELDTSAVWRSGCAYGLDSVVAYNQAPVRTHLFIPHGKWHNEKMVKEVALRGALVSRIEGGYRIRNEKLVRGSDVLHAFLRSPEFYRSGEWMTKNIADRAGVTVVEHIIP